MKIRIATFKRFRFYPSHLWTCPFFYGVSWKSDSMGNHISSCWYDRTWYPDGQHLCLRRKTIALLLFFTMHLKMMSLIHNLRRELVKWRTLRSRSPNCFWRYSKRCSFFLFKLGILTMSKIWKLIPIRIISSCRVFSLSWISKKCGIILTEDGSSRIAYQKQDSK